MQNQIPFILGSSSLDRKTKLAYFCHLLFIPACINTEGVEGIVTGGVLAAEVQQLLRCGHLVPVLRQGGQLRPVVLVLIVTQNVETISLDLKRLIDFRLREN